MTSGAGEEVTVIVASSGGGRGLSKQMPLYTLNLP